MKGIIIYENDLGAINAAKLKHASFCCEFTADDITDTLKGTPVICKSATCNKDDTYDFETGALIALMKMCGVDKVKKAAKETFFDVAENSVNEYEEKIHTLEEKIECLNMSVCAKSILNNKLLKEIKELNYIKSCNESTIESLEKTRDLLKAENEELKKHNNELENYNNQLEYEVKIVKDAHNMCEEKYQDLKAKKVDLVYTNYKLKVENEKLKTDCEKLCHGYNADMVICGSRQNGKQYTALVELFKKIDQKKVDAAYKEAYNTTLPVWQKEALRQAYEIRKESKEKPELPRTLDINGTTYRKSIQIKDFSNDQLDSLIEGSRAFTRKCVDEWIKPLTKREEMWGEIFALHKESDVIIVVEKEDVDAFLHEIEKRIPEIRWASWQKIFEAKGTIKDIYEELMTHDTIYFRLSKETKLSYLSDPHIYRYRDLEHVSYLPPMRWDLFKKGRLAVKVSYSNYKEFYEACEKELGKKPMTVYTGEYTVSICKKHGYFEIFTVEDHKKTGRKIVDWEDVRENTFTMEDPYDTWVW